MYHVGYMSINFQQTRVNRSVQTVHTNIFAKNRDLHKFATTYSNFEKNDYLDMHHRITYMYKFLAKSGWYVGLNQSKTVHTNLFAKFASCVNLQLPIIIFKKIDSFKHASS